MTEPYAISYHSTLRLIKIVVRGYWSLQTLGAFQEELQHTVASASHATVPLNLFCDSRSFAVQPRDVADGFIETMRLVQFLNGGHAAILASGMLVKLQAQRVFTHPAIKVFRDEDKARAWVSNVAANIVRHADTVGLPNAERR